jgi:hypothetical protein
MKSWRGLLVVVGIGVAVTNLFLLHVLAFTCIKGDWGAKINVKISYLTSTPATTGVFIYLNIPRSPKNSIRYLENSIRYLAPSPTYSANLKPL